MSALGGTVESAGEEMRVHATMTRPAAALLCLMLVPGSGAGQGCTSVPIARRVDAGAAWGF